jgi:O-acetylserine/cysteine efflux transporter
MKPLHIALAIMVAVIWGIAFVVSRIGLDVYSAPQLTALRFIVASIAVLWLPRPQIPWSTLVAIGLTVFTGQFLLQFFGIAGGMPAGLTAVVVQTQALFTVLFAAMALGDKPNLQQVTGIVIAFIGLVMIGGTLSANIPLAAFTLTLGSALSWAVGNVLIKRLPKINMLHLMAWASLVPPLPAFAVSLLIGNSRSIWTALVHAPLPGIVAPVYLGLVASVLAYAIWGNLLQRYSAGAVAPFALLAPVVGAIASAMVYGEHFGPARLAGMACMLAGLAVVVVRRKSTNVSRVGHSEIPMPRPPRGAVHDRD